MVSQTNEQALEAAIELENQRVLLNDLLILLADFFLKNCHGRCHADNPNTTRETLLWRTENYVVFL